MSLSIPASSFPSQAAFRFCSQMVFSPSEENRTAVVTQLPDQTTTPGHFRPGLTSLASEQLPREGEREQGAGSGLGPCPDLGSRAQMRGPGGESACWVEGATWENVPEAQWEDRL